MGDWLSQMRARNPPQPRWQQRPPAPAPPFQGDPPDNLPTRTPPAAQGRRAVAGLGTGVAVAFVSLENQQRGGSRKRGGSGVERRHRRARAAIAV